MDFSVREGLGLDQLQGVGACQRLGAAGDLQFTENAVGVGLHGAEGDHQGCRPAVPCAVKLPAGLVNTKAVALSSQANQASVPTVIRGMGIGELGSLAAITNLPSSTRAVVRAMLVSLHLLVIVGGLLRLF